MSEDKTPRQVYTPCLHCPAMIVGVGKTLDDAKANLDRRKKLHAWKCPGRRPS